MHASPTSTEDRQLWPMKDAAKQVGVGLPRLYKRLREKGLFTMMGIDGRNMPTKKLQDERLFIVQSHAWWDPSIGQYRPCPKVFATYHGLILLQEIADELEREKQQAAGKRPGVQRDDNSHQRQGAVDGHQPEPPTAGGGGE